MKERVQVKQDLKENKYHYKLTTAQYRYYKYLQELYKKGAKKPLLH